MTTRPAQTETLVFPDAHTMAREVAHWVTERAREAVRERGTFYWALSGGSTPRPVYSHLAEPPLRDTVDWSRVHVFFGDERFVPPTSSESNYGMARESLLSHIPVPERSVYRVETESVTPERAAELYEETLRRAFNVSAGVIPMFDVILLGLGPDGHTASLFPGSEGLSERDKLIVANYVESMKTWRISFTYPLINAARRVSFLVQGSDKAERVSEVMSGKSDLPASGIHPADGKLLWFLDERAASGLNARPKEV